MKKLMVAIAGLVIVGIVVAGIVYKREIDRLSFASSLFNGAEQYENFNRMAEMYPVHTLTAAPVPFQFQEGTPVSLPETYTHETTAKETEAFLSETDTSALLVIEDGRIRLERYMLTGGPDVRWMSMSVAKSFISALVGIALDEGHIGGVEEPVTQYAPSLSGSAYGGVRIKDVLQMSSGARWNEDYSDSDSDINRFGRIFALGGSLNAFAAELEREREPGSYNQYNSVDTQVLGLLLVKATGRSIADYMEEKLWHPLGMESDGYWLIDSEGMEMVFGGLNATARDYAKLGQLYLDGGLWQGEQVVPAAWVEASIIPDGPHLVAGENPLSDYPMGYGYQWWLMDGDRGEFSAIGVYNQFIYVDPSRRLVIVKLSAYSDYGLTNDESSFREFETIALFRAIGASLD